MGEKTDRRLEAIAGGMKALRRRINGKASWALGSVSVVGLLAFAFTNGWIAIAFETTAHAASTYETKTHAAETFETKADAKAAHDDADRWRHRFAAEMSAMESEHTRQMRELGEHAKVLEALQLDLARVITVLEYEQRMKARPRPPDGR